MNLSMRGAPTPRSPAGPSMTRCLEKAMEIPIIYSVSLNAEIMYNSLKGKNKIYDLGVAIVEESCIIAWQRLNPLMGHLRKPINFADAIACSVIDEVKEKYPAIMNPTDELIESGTKVVLHSPLTQKALVGLEKALGFAEAIVTLVPSISVEDEQADEPTTLISKTMKPVKLCYVTATWPLRATADFIHSRRANIADLTRTHLQPDAIAINRGDVSIMSLTDQIFQVPRYLLGFIGNTAVKLYRKKFMKPTIRFQFDAYDQPSTSGVAWPSTSRHRLPTLFSYPGEDEMDDEVSIFDYDKIINTLPQGRSSDSSFDRFQSDMMALQEFEGLLPDNFFANFAANPHQAYPVSMPMGMPIHGAPIFHNISQAELGVEPIAGDPYPDHLPLIPLDPPAAHLVNGLTNGLPGDLLHNFNGV